LGVNTSVENGVIRPTVCASARASVPGETTGMVGSHMPRSHEGSPFAVCKEPYHHIYDCIIDTSANTIEENIEKIKTSMINNAGNGAFQQLKQKIDQKGTIYS
jgi:hypothetical protein